MQDSHNQLISSTTFYIPLISFTKLGKRKRKKDSLLPPETFFSPSSPFRDSAEDKTTTGIDSQYRRCGRHYWNGAFGRR